MQVVKQVLLSYIYDHGHRDVICCYIFKTVETQLES